MLEKIDKIQELLNVPNVDTDSKTALANMQILNLLVDLKAEVKQLILSGVSNRRELLISFAKYWNDKDLGYVKIDDIEGKDPNDIDMFLQQ